MAEMKKIVLFLVEGITDKVALEGILPKLINTANVEFMIANTDVTTKRGVTPHNAKSKVHEYIKTFLNQGRYQKKDLQTTIHLIDTDGAFIPPSAVMDNQSAEHVLYFRDRIETNNIEGIKERNKIKSSVLKMLYTCSNIGNIPYYVYFFSSNREHVFHDTQSLLSKEEKMTLAESFSEQYADSPQDFIELIKSDDIRTEGNYQETWEFIGRDTNSLTKKCNFHLFFRTE